MAEKLNSCQALKDERGNRMALTSEVRRYLVDHLAGRQSLIREQVILAIRSSGEISSSERLTDQQLEVLQLCSHPVVGWLHAPPGVFGLLSIQMAPV